MKDKYFSKKKIQSMIGIGKYANRDMLVTQRDVEYINERLKERARVDSTPVDKSDRSVV